MRRLQLLMDEDLDDALERHALERRVSKSALVRELVRERLGPIPSLEDDPLTRMIGADSVEPEPIDAVVYDWVPAAGRPARNVASRRRR
ncbi:MAG: CopG family transcriptional regulator [Candidatus Limnocylindria bacterium]